jgi:phosphoadenosine phosphosulfate reductase
MGKMNIEKINIQLKDKSPKEIVKWALEYAEKPIVTTNFRPYEVALLHATSHVKNEIKVCTLFQKYYDISK